MTTRVMNVRRLLLVGLGLGLVTAVIAAGGTQSSNEFSPPVDATGSISVPRDYRRWAFLGSWYVVAKGAGDTSGAAGFHTVYTQPSTVEHFRKTGAFPDGAVLVKELLKAESGELTTGAASWPTHIEGWFVMVKDTRGRYARSPLWGNGWGWAFFNADDPNKTITTNWRTECLGCHVPAKSTDWVYTKGYPILQHGPK